MSKPSSVEADLTLYPKVTFLNSVFLFAGIVALGMSFFRWQSSAVLGAIDFVFSLCSFALLYYLNNHKERIEAISSIALTLSYGLFTAIYLLAPYNTARLSLFFLLSASAFFLKGRPAGLAWLIVILLTIVTGHFLSGFDTAYSHVDIITTCLYLLALFIIFLNYERFKEKVNESERDKEVLRLGEERFRAIIEASPVPFALNDEKQNITYLNLSFIRTFGYTLEDIPTLAHWWPKAYPDPVYRQWVATTWRSHLEKAKQRNEPFEPLELNIRCKDGSVRTALTSASRIGASFEKVHLVSLYDITERKQAEEKLRTLSTAVEQSPISVVITDRDAVIQYVNPYYIKITGYSREEVIGQNPRILQSGQTPKETYVKLWDALVGGQSWHGEFINKRKNGELYWEEAHIAPVVDAAGATTHYVCMKLEITRRKQAEDALRESQARQSAILDNSPYITWLKDAEGRYLKINKAYADYVRLKDAREIVGKTDLDLWPREFAEKYRADDAEVMASRQQKHVEEPSLDGNKIHWVETFKTPVIDESGNILGTTGFARDITERKQMEQILRDSEARFRAVAQSANDAIVTSNEAGYIMDCNAATERFFGYTKDEIIGQPVTMLMPECFRNRHNEGMARVVAGGVPHIIGKTVALAGLHKEGMEFPLEFSLARWENSSGQFFTAIIRNITERKQAEQALAESESRFREIFNAVSDAIFIHDAETGRLIDVNRRMCEMYGFTREEALACGPDDLSAGTPPYSSAEAAEKIRLAGTGGPQTFEWLARACDGHLFWVEVSLRIASISGNQRILATVRDIAERKQAEEQIHKLAFYDTLTQLPNRRLLNDRLEQAIVSSKRSGHYGALMFLDLDNFKPLNDTHGHDVGDLLLMQVARRLSACVREVDTVARFGGDEFIVMLGELDADQDKSCTQAGIVAEKIRGALAETYLLKIQQAGKAEITIVHHCAASIGVVVFNAEASAEDIIKKADMAMYQAKELGRNRVKFFDLNS